MLEEQFNPKQLKAMDSLARILVLHGAKRAGKTYVLILIFLLMVLEQKGKKRKFVIGGATMASIRSNILDDLETLLGYSITLSKYNNFELFGNNILVRPGSTSDSWKGVRGFTAHGALLNEGTALHETYIKEVISRCSGEGARVLIDTNPENPIHPIKTDYIDKHGQQLEDGKINIEAVHFRLEDNTFLDPVYIESIKLSTPSGMFYERDIEGKWVSGQGVVYKDFSENRHKITAMPKGLVKVYAGVDWGYEHYGSIVVVAEDSKGNHYLIEEVAEQHKEIDFWVDKAKEIKGRYGNIKFYCDSARPEHLARFAREGLNTIRADKSVLSGIEVVSKLFKTNKLFIIDTAKKTLEELYMYAWNERTGEPLKVHDDALDALRYALYTEGKNKQDFSYYKSKDWGNYLE